MAVPDFAASTREYENVIRDLLSVPWLQIKGKLPQGGEAYRYGVPAICGVPVFLVQ